MFETILSFIFSQYAAAVIGAVGVFILGYMGVRWKNSKDKILMEDVSVKVTALRITKLQRRNGKLVALLLAHAGRELAHKSQYEHILHLVEDRYSATAKKRLGEYIGKAADDFAEINSSLSEISDISEVVYEEDIKEVLEEESGE